MTGKGEVRPIAFKETFWNTKRVEGGYKLKDIAELLGFTLGITGMYFSGQAMPSDETIETLCDFFGVDVIQGTHAFIEAHKKWNAEHKRTLKLGKKTVEKKVETPQNAHILPDSVLEVLYNNLPYKLFKAIYDGTEGEIDPLEYLYNKIGFAEYDKIYKAIKEVK